MLDAGLSVLSLGSGGVLGAFLLGTLWPATPSRAVLWGMAAGLLVPGMLWAFTPVAWTWYAFVGALSTVVIARGVSWRAAHGTGASAQ